MERRGEPTVSEAKSKSEAKTVKAARARVLLSAKLVHIVSHVIKIPVFGEYQYDFCGDSPNWFKNRLANRLLALLIFAEFSG